MAMTNAERQAAFQKRKKQRLAECVTPDDVIEATRIMYQQFLSDSPEEEVVSFDEWAKSAGGKQAWSEMVPCGMEDWQLADLSSNEAELVQRVGAVIAAARTPPTV